MSRDRENLKNKTYSQWWFNPSGIISRMSCGTIKRKIWKNTKLFTTKCDAKRNSRSIRDRVRDPCHRVFAQLPFLLMSLPFALEYEWSPKRDAGRRVELKIKLSIFRYSSDFFFFFYRNVNCLEERTVDRGGLNREEKKQTEPTGTMNRVGRTSATKWEASGTAAQVAWRHRVSSLFCHSTASTAREKGACTTSQTPSLHLRDALLLSEVHYRARRNILLDDSPRIYRFRRPNSLAFTYSSR